MKTCQVCGKHSTPSSEWYVSGTLSWCKAGDSLTTWAQKLLNIHTPWNTRTEGRGPGSGEIKATSQPAAEASVSDPRAQDLGFPHPQAAHMALEEVGKMRLRTLRSLFTWERGAGTSHPQLRERRRMRASPKPCSEERRTSRWEANLQCGPWAWTVSLKLLAQKPHTQDRHGGLACPHVGGRDRKTP